MDIQQIHAIRSLARDCALALLENASFIERELPNVRIPDDLRRQATDLCSDLTATKHDVLSELFELDELVDAPSPDPAVLAGRVDRVVSWLSADLPKMHRLVTALQIAAEREAEYSQAYVLIAESSANILLAFNRVRAAVPKEL
jgi:hypothetical protein